MRAYGAGRVKNEYGVIPRQRDDDDDNDDDDCDGDESLAKESYVFTRIIARGNDLSNTEKQLFFPLPKFYFFIAVLSTLRFVNVN